MVVRIRFHSGPKVRLVGTKNQRLALAFAALLKPAMLVAWSLVFWRVASDLGQAGSFGIEQGPFSHWQTWLTVALSLHAVNAGLTRWGRRPRLAEASLPEVEKRSVTHQALPR